MNEQAAPKPVLFLLYQLPFASWFLSHGNSLSGQRWGLFLLNNALGLKPPSGNFMLLGQDTDGLCCAALRTPLCPCGCSFAQLCPTLHDPMDCSKPSFPVLHHLPEFAQTQVHSINDAIQPSHPPLRPSPPATNLSQHQGLFQ